jgi:hypothetical protein
MLTLASLTVRKFSLADNILSWIEKADLKCKIFWHSLLEVKWG